ncbi:hypothetical protein SAMN04488044_3083 [Cognatishimia maritima]|uniref:Uncharacterized protein n=1 Tax=Cognatishimia maritima TaxID=870908 RepID=A0A1M5V9H2_9RHOB|nr:hypothetical protein SAMN04488044_3083 [Cognatishimia maritima]
MTKGNRVLRREARGGCLFFSQFENFFDHVCGNYLRKLKDETLAFGRKATFQNAF